MVTSQMSPRPPVLSTPLLHVVVSAIVAALELPASPSEPSSRRPLVNRIARERRMRITCPV